MLPARKSGGRFGQGHLLKKIGVAALLSAGMAFAALRCPAAEAPPPVGTSSSLFDGHTLAGWEGSALWRVEGGLITGGSLTEKVKHNDFLASTRDYTNFIVRLGSSDSRRIANSLSSHGPAVQTIGGPATADRSLARPSASGRSGAVSGSPTARECGTGTLTDRVRRPLEPDPPCARPWDRGRHDGAGAGRRRRPGHPRRPGR